MARGLPGKQTDLSGPGAGRAGQRSSGRSRFRSLLFSLVLVASAANAGEDMTLTIGQDGVVSGLPTSFEPVFLNISGLGSHSPVVQFRSGDTVKALSPCVTRYIGSAQMSDVRVWGSWYHDTSSFPHYYINVSFREPGYAADPLSSSSVDAVFNLHTAEIIGAYRYSQVSRPDGWHQATTTKLPVDCAP